LGLNVIGRLPALRWLSGYQRNWLRSDLVAGATTAAVVIPQAMAYATIAGLPVQFGLYCAFVPMVVYAALGTSRPLSVSTTSSISLITAATLASVEGDPATVASTLAVLVGAVLLAAGALRLGFVADFVSDSVLAGFKVGIGLVIAADQLGRVLGVSLTGDHFFEKVWSAVRQVDEANGATVALAVGSIAALLALARFAPRIPAPLVVVAGGIAAVSLFDPDIALIAAVPEGLPSFDAPDLGLFDELFPPALGVALIALTESIAAARSFRKGEDQPVDANRELVALGGASLGGGLFQAYPTGGGLSQTAVNDRAGASTQLASLVTAGAVVLTLLVLAPVFDDLAEATLGAVVMVAAVGLVLSPELARMRRVRTRDYAFALVALGGVLVLGTLKGILVAVVVSLLVLLYQANHPPLVVLGRKRGTEVFRDHNLYPEDETFPGLLVVRVEGMLYFANARRTFARLLELVDSSSPRVLLLDLSGTPDIDLTAVNLAGDFIRSLEERGVLLWFARVRGRPLAMLSKLAEGRAFPDVRTAVESHVTGTPRNTPL
jgi:sulfate permease, SulP family